MEMMDGGVFYYFLIAYLLSTVVTVLCNQDCSLVGSGQHWNRICTVQTENSCGYIKPSTMLPSAPRKLRVVDYVYNPWPDFSTLAMNITWQLPENITGLNGFIVELLKTSYVVGFQECKKITFDRIHTGSSESHLSTVNFTLSDWHDIDVDGYYSIKVTSLDSGQVAKIPSYRTKRCFDVPQVNKCLVIRDCSKDGCRGLVPPREEWKPAKPTVSAISDSVHVTCQVYPGNFWLNYRVNLWSHTLSKTRPELSRTVNSNGSSRSFDVHFKDVPPDTYEARVFIFPGDTYMAVSEPFNVTAFMPILAPTVAKTTAIPDEPTSIPVTDEGNTGTPSEEVHEPEVEKSVPDFIKIAAGTGSGVFVALLIIIFLLSVWRWKSRGSSESSHSSVSRLPETSCLVNGMSQADGNSLQNNVENRCEPMPINCGGSYFQGSDWTDFSDYHGRHTVKGINDYDCVTDLGSLADDSAVTV